MRQQTRWLVILSTLTAIVAWLTPASIHAQPAPAELRLSAPVSTAIGETITLQATLLTASGEPIERASIVLFEQTGFLDVSAREIEITSGVTTDTGVAILRYIARREGVRNLIARYEGSDDAGATSIAIELPVATGGATYSVEPPPGIPGVNRFLIVALMAVVWGTMLVVAAHVVAIAREGATEREAQS